MIIDKSKPEELEQILSVARRVGAFSDEEVDTVAELFEGYLKDPLKSGYNYLTCREGDRVLGFACWGPTALSQGAVDLYWICTAKDQQGKGVAGQLFQAVEEAARNIGRWLMVIWTSSKPEYAPARRFYAKMGCELATQIRDFYDRDDDLCVFIRRLDS